MDHQKSAGDISYSNYHNLSKISIDIQGFQRLLKAIQDHPRIPITTQCHLRIPWLPNTTQDTQGHPRPSKDSQDCLRIYIYIQAFPKLLMITKTHNLHIQRYPRPMKTPRPLNTTKDFWGSPKATQSQQVQKEKRREVHMEDDSNGPT